MRRLDRYVLTLFLTRLVVVGAALLAIYLGVDLVEKLRWVTRSQVPLAAFFHFFLLRLPLALSQILPLSSLFAGALTVSALNRRQELTAMRCAGIAPARALLPILIGGALAGLAQLTVTESWLPSAQRELQALEAGDLAPALRREAATHDRWYLDGTSRLRVGAQNGREHLLEVEVLSVSASGALWQHLLAPSVRWEGRRWLALTAEVWSFDAARGARYEVRSDMTLPVTLNPSALEAAAPIPEQLDHTALQEAIRSGRQTGRQVGGLVRALELRWLLPLSCLLLVLLGAPGCAHPGAATSMAGAVARALGIGLAYLLTSGGSLLMIGAGSPFSELELVIPQVLCLVIGTIAFLRIP